MSAPGQTSVEHRPWPGHDPRRCLTCTTHWTTTDTLIWLSATTDGGTR